MRKPIIAGNWKMNKNIKEALEFVKEVGARADRDDVEAVICAPFLQLKDLKEATKGTKIKVGAQNMHFETSGAFTGEVSAEMLQEIGMDYVIIGHSERREYFNETDETVNRKLKVLLEEGITPILCVGESLEVREKKQEQAFVCGQLGEAFAGIPQEYAEKVVIAYEPIWAIGTGHTATPEQAEEMCAFIRGMMQGLYDMSIGDKLIIQYGGSMKPGNAKELLEKTDINGGLIGGASLKVKDFAEIAKTAAELAE